MRLFPAIVVFYPKGTLVTSRREEIQRLRQQVVSLKRLLNILDEQIATHGGRNFAPVGLVNHQDETHELLRQAQANLDTLGEQSTSDRPPYLGLKTFSEEDHELFCGREKLRDLLLQRIERDTLIAVFGPSGSGKSSLVLAGLLAGLRSGDFIEGSQNWHSIIIRPGARPVNALAVALSSQRPFTNDVRAYFTLLDRLRAEPRALLDSIDQVLAVASIPCIVLVVDQLEELWTYATTPEEQEQFIQHILTAATAPDRRVRVVLTMRADFLHSLAQHRDLAIALTALDTGSNRIVIVSPMSKEELRSAIEIPLEQFGGEFEPELVNELITQTVGRIGSLPLLEFTLLELWQRREPDQSLTWKAYKDLGGVEGALAKRATEIQERHYPSAEPHKLETLRVLLLQLVQPGDGAVNVRRRALLAHLATPTMPAKAIQSFLEPLVDERLLTTSGSNTELDDQSVELSHEALITSWPQLRDWVEESRAILIARRRLEETARDWAQNERHPSYLYQGIRLQEAERVAVNGGLDENSRAFVHASRSAARRRRLSQIAMAISTGLLITLVGAIVWLFWSRQVSWQQVSTGECDGEITALIRGSPDTQTMYYAGTQQGGICRSTDLVSWRASREGLPPPPKPATSTLPETDMVFRLATDIHDPQFILAFLYNNGLYRSVDGGKNWQSASRGIEVPLGDDKKAVSIAIANQLILVAFNDGRLYESRDRGLIWRSIRTQSAAFGVKDVLMATVNGEDRAIIGTQHGLFYSNLPRNAGANWAWQPVPGIAVPIAMLSRPLDGSDGIFCITYNKISSDALFFWDFQSVTNYASINMIRSARAIVSIRNTAYILSSQSELYRIRKGFAPEQLQPPPATVNSLLAISAADHRTRILIGYKNGLLEYPTQFDEQAKGAQP